MALSPRVNVWPARLLRLMGELITATVVFLLALVLPSVLGGPSVQSLTGANGLTGATNSGASSGSSGPGNSGSGSSGSGNSGSGNSGPGNSGAAAFDSTNSGSFTFDTTNSGAASVSSGSKSIYVVGDSLTEGAEPWLGSALARQGWHLQAVSARVGRGVTDGLSILRSRASSLPPTVMVALGTNDLGARPADVFGWLKSARSIVGSRRLVWVNLCITDGGNQRLASFRQINIALTEFAPGFHIELANWCAFATRHGIVPGPDGVHYVGSAYRQRADFYAQVVAGSR